MLRGIRTHAAHSFLICSQVYRLEGPLAGPGDRNATALMAIGGVVAGGDHQIVG